jgi:hypothetical protein
MKNTISNLQRFDLIGADSDLHIGPESCGDYVKYADVQSALQHTGQAQLEVIRDDSGCPTEVRIAEALQHAGQGEAVGWQFFQDGKWHFGCDNIKDHRKNTEAAGFPVRDVFSAPQPAVPVVPEEWVNRLNEALDLTYRDDIRPARSCLLQLRKSLLSAAKGEQS